MVLSAAVATDETCELMVVAVASAGSLTPGIGLCVHCDGRWEDMHG